MTIVAPIAAAVAAGLTPLISREEAAFADALTPTIFTTLDVVPIATATAAALRPLLGHEESGYAEALVPTFIYTITPNAATAVAAALNPEISTGAITPDAATAFATALVPTISGSNAIFSVTLAETPVSDYVLMAFSAGSLIDPSTITRNDRVLTFATGESPPIDVYYQR